MTGVRRSGRLAPGVHRNVLAAGLLEHHSRVPGTRLQRDVPRDDRDRVDRHFGRAQRQQDRHRVVDAGVGIDDHPPRAGRLGGRRTAAPAMSTSAHHAPLRACRAPLPTANRPRHQLDEQLLERVAIDLRDHVHESRYGRRPGVPLRALPARLATRPSSSRARTSRRRRSAPGSC